MMPDASRPADPLVFFFGSDLGLLEALRTRLRTHQITLRGVQTVAGLMRAAGKHAARVLILETGCLPPTRAVVSILDRLEAGTGIRPRLFCLAGRAFGPAPGSEHCREALATFQAPFDATIIAARILASLTVEVTRRQRVLIVDALPWEADEIQAVLRGDGLIAERLADPDQVIPTLERFPTDLVLLDLNLPQNASRSILAAIRDHEGFFSLPIVFLSAEATTEHHSAVLRLGGDEYLARPVAADRVLAAVRGRLAEARAAAPFSRLPTTDGGLALPLFSFAKLVKRLERTILDHATVVHGQAILFIRLDDSQEVAALDLAGLDRVRRMLPELVARQAGSALHGVSLNGDGCYAWVRGETDPEVLEVAESIREGALSLALPAGIGASQVSVNIGVGSFAPRVDNALTLISRAEAAGEQARRAGGDQVRLYREPPPPLNSTAPGDGQILPLLRRAVDGPGSGFRLLYQPILPLRKSRHERYEVLLRLRAPNGEIMSPLTFLPVAERHGLLPALDRWVLAGALQTLSSEQGANRRTRLMIHQTVASLAQPRWLSWVRDEIVRLGLIRQRPVLEFVARDIIADESLARRIFPELQRLGLDICLAGVTDSEEILALIGRLPVSFVKLARELVSREAGARLSALVEAIHQLGPRLIASGIEDPEAIGRIWSSGVDYVQGNFIQFPEETLNFQFHESMVG